MLKSRTDEVFDGLPDFWAQLQRTWALGKDGAQALLILSGSVQTAVERIFGSRNEPLFGRSDQMMIVQPFTTSLIGQIYSDAKPSVFVSKDLLLFGGVARYIEALVDAQAVTQEKNPLISFFRARHGVAEGRRCAAGQ